jgi:hypothetical protein
MCQPQALSPLGPRAQTVQAKARPDLCEGLKWAWAWLEISEYLCFGLQMLKKNG